MRITGTSQHKTQGIESNETFSIKADIIGGESGRLWQGIANFFRKITNILISYIRFKLPVN